MDLLLRLGFQTPRSASRTCRGIDEVLRFYDEFEKMRNGLPYDVDGIVVKVDDYRLQGILGEVARAPRWAIAGKYPAEEIETRVLNITVQVGRSGVLTPVAELFPVAVGGVMVRRATLHNQAQIDEKDVRVGDLVVIRRAGEVIPEVVRSISSGLHEPTRSKPYRIPETCPACGAKTEHVEGGAAVRCTGNRCDGKIKTALRHFVSRNAMDIDGIGKKLSDTLVDAGLVREFADLYVLSASDFAGLDGKGEKSAENIVAGIAKSRDTTVSRLLFALGIPLVGEKTAQDIAGRFGDIDSVMLATEEDLLGVDGIGGEIAASVSGYFRGHDTRESVKKLLSHLVFAKESASNAGPLSGKTFLFTGTLSVPRSKAQAMVREAGGTVAAGIGKGVDYLVAGEDAGSKLEKAKKIGIEVIDEEAFRRIVYRKESQP